MMKKITAAFLGCLLVAVFAVPEVRADLVTPSSAAATSAFGFNPPSLLIDGSGLDGIGDVQDQHHDNVEENNWLSDVFAKNPPVASEIDLEFTLDANYNLSAAYIWNYNNIAGGTVSTPTSEVLRILVCLFRQAWTTWWILLRMLGRTLWTRQTLQVKVRRIPSRPRLRTLWPSMSSASSSRFSRISHQMFQIRQILEPV